MLDEKNRQRKQKFKRANEKIAAKRKADAKRAEDEAKFLALKNKHAKEKKKREDADAEVRRQDKERRMKVHQCQLPCIYHSLHSFFEIDF